MTFLFLTSYLNFFGVWGFSWWEITLWFVERRLVVATLASGHLPSCGPPVVSLSNMRVLSSYRLSLSATTQLDGRTRDRSAPLNF